MRHQAKAKSSVGGAPGTSLPSASAQALRRSSLLECVRCGFRDSRRRVVPGKGPIPCGVCLIGEAPGFVEDALGEPFVGRSGELLEEAIRSSGRKREELYITNVVKCRPPNNRTPSDREARICINAWLWDELQDVAPKRIVTLGRLATKQFTTLRSMRNTQGKGLRSQIPYLKIPIFLYPVYHPSAVLREPRLRGAFLQSVGRALR